MRHFGISSAPNAADDPDFASDDLRMNVCYPRVAETTVPAHTPAAPHEAGTVTQFSRRPRGGGIHATGASAAKTHGELFRMPAGSLSDDPVRSILETPNLGRALLDVTMSFITAFGFVIAVLLLLFF